MPSRSVMITSPPLPDEPVDHLNVLGHIVREVALVLPRQPRDHSHSQVGEPQTEEERPGDHRECEGEPREGKAQEEVRHEVTAVGPAIIIHQ